MRAYHKRVGVLCHPVYLLEWGWFCLAGVFKKKLLTLGEIPAGVVALCQPEESGIDGWYGHVSLRGDAITYAVTYLCEFIYSPSY